MSISPILLLILAAVVVVAPIKARKLDQTTSISGSTDDQQIKCGGCPCNNPCITTPPPPPPSPSPPPPPPSPKKPSPTPGFICPPPPSTYIYINGPPGNLYPVDPYASSADRRRVWVAPSLVVVIAVVGMVSFW